MSQISSYLQNQKERVVELQKKLVSIPALGPDNQGQGEQQKADYLLSYLADAGFTEIIEVNSPDSRVPDGYRPNIIARIPGKDTGRTLWILTHLDIVPAGDRSLWQSDPFSLRVEGDLVYGRGVEDNHQGMVSSILAASAFIDIGIKPDINLGLILVADEETGNRHGLPYVLDARKDLFGQDDYYLVPDIGSSDSKLLEIAEKSMLWLKVSVKGRQCHASRPDKAINSLVAASAFVLKIRELNDIFSKRNSLFKPSESTFTPTRKEANVPNINTIPGLDVFYIDCRVLPDYDLDDVFTQIKAIGSEIEAEYRVKVEYETVLREQSAPFMDPSSEVVVRLSQAIENVLGISPVPQGVGGGTVAVFLRRKGFSAVVWSTLSGTAHQPNECSSITNTINDARVMAYMACPW